MSSATMLAKCIACSFEGRRATGDSDNVVSDAADECPRCGRRLVRWFPDECHDCAPDGERCNRCGTVGGDGDAR